MKNIEEIAKRVKEKLKSRQKIHGNVKCGCGHTQKSHYAGEGCCHDCGCTWFYPNDRYINEKRKKFFS